MTEATLNSRMSSAELCRRNGWGRGTVLAAERSPKQGPGPAIVIVITGVGDKSVLAADRDSGEEQIWNLTTRAWRLALPPHQAGARGEQRGIQ
jgi:hypothetical protein